MVIDALRQPLWHTTQWVSNPYTIWLACYQYFSSLTQYSLQFFSACARTKGDAKTKLAAFNMVINALIEIQESTVLRTDLYTWPAIWNACQLLLDFKRDLAWINRIFELTVRSGQVNEYLFNNMRNYLPPQYLQKKLKTMTAVDQLTPYDLPHEWTCNVKLARAPRGQRRERAEQDTRKGRRVESS